MAFRDEDAGLLVGADPGEDRGVDDRSHQLRVVETIELGARERSLHGDPEGSAHCLRDERVVSGDHLDRDPERGKTSDRCGRRRLGLIEEDQVPGQVQVVLVGRTHRGHSRGRPRRNRHDSIARRELAFEHCSSLVGDVPAAVENRFGCAFGDDDSVVRRIVDEHRRAPPLVVERCDADAAKAVDRHVSRVGRIPDGGVEGVASDCGVPGDGSLVAHQPEREHVRIVGPGDIDRAGEGDVTVGERAGLVGEEHVDVTEVFDAHQAFDEHLALREAP